jgi:predicted ArsR family transcriptional regulator
MSYMGIKQHCVEMEKKGLLDTWRNPKALGRPEKLYRLTEKGASFFPEVGNELSCEILHSVQDLYGPNAPDKLLFSYYSKKTEAYQRKVKGATPSEKAASFARLRDLEGHCAELEVAEDGTVSVVEYHNPLREVAAHFPTLNRMEELMFSRVLSTLVERTESSVSGLTKYTYRLPALSQRLSA